MENKATGVQSTLERLAKINPPRGEKVAKNYKEFKAKVGKNNLLILPTPMTGDPFLDWGSHKSLLDLPSKDTACNKHNHGQECLICDVIADLQKQAWKANFPIWKPIEKKIRYYSYVIDLDNISEGLQLWSYGKSVLSQFETWLKDLEGDEKEFYDQESPEKIIVTYDDKADPMNMYKLNKKPLKAFDKKQVAEWTSEIKPLNEIFKFDKTNEEIEVLLQTYTNKIQESLNSTDVSEEENNLDSLKK